jgi:hypothetical protein
MIVAWPDYRLTPLLVCPVSRHVRMMLALLGKQQHSLCGSANEQSSRGCNRRLVAHKAQPRMLTDFLSGCCRGNRRERAMPFALSTKWKAFTHSTTGEEGNGFRRLSLAGTLLTNDASRTSLHAPSPVQPALHLDFLRHRQAGRFASLGRVDGDIKINLSRRSWAMCLKHEGSDKRRPPPVTTKRRHHWLHEW